MHRVCVWFAESQWILRITVTDTGLAPRCTLAGGAGCSRAPSNQIQEDHPVGPPSRATERSIVYVRVQRVELSMFPGLIDDQQLLKHSGRYARWFDTELWQWTRIDEAITSLGSNGRQTNELLQLSNSRLVFCLFGLRCSVYIMASVPCGIMIEEQGTTHLLTYRRPRSTYHCSRLDNEMLIACKHHRRLITHRANVT